jgi:hypothetical protein
MLKKTILLKISGREGLRYGRCPVTFGVPFADGELKKGAFIRLVDENGTPMPVQTQCLTTWDRDLAYVKWLLVDAQVDLQEGWERTLALQCPAGELPPEPEQRVSVREEGAYLCADSGPMRLWIRRTFHEWESPRRPDLFARCAVRTEGGWRDLFRGSPGPLLYMRDQAGNEYDSAAAPPPEVVVEEQGPLRACIRIDGHHASEQGQRFCPYTLRVHLYAGQRDLRFCHTFLYDQDPQRVELAAIGMRFPLALGGALRAAVGGERGVYWAPNWHQMRVLQFDDLHYEVRRDGSPFGSGGKAAGWASLNGDRGGAVAVIRDAWQVYPKGMALSAEGIDVQIWPDSCGQNLAFTTPFQEPALRFVGEDGAPLRDEDEIRRLLDEHPTAPLHLKSLDIRSVQEAAWVEGLLEKYARGRTVTYNDTGTSTGIGASKTTEVHLLLSGTALGDDEARALASRVQEPVVAAVDPQHVCASGAFGHFYHRGDARFAQVDRDIDDLFHMVVVDPVTRCRLYGMMRYGDMVCAHSPAVGWVYLLYKHGDPARALRYVGPYHNEAVDQIEAVWGQFVRTGDRNAALIAERYAQSAADVAFVHAYPGHPERVGLIHYHNGHSWSGSLSPSHSVVSGILTGYYMTGNRRLLDVALEAADRIVHTQEPAGILSNRERRLHRAFTGPLSVLTDAYQATWAEKYGELARRSLNWLLRTIPEPGRLPNSVFTRGERGDEAVVQPPCLPEVAWGNKYHLYEPALRLFPSRTLRDLIVDEADYWVCKSPKEMLNYQCTTICLAYDLTGDVRYAAYARHLLDCQFKAFAQGVRDEEQMDFQALWYSGYIPRLMCTVARATDVAPEGFQAAVDAWWGERQGMPDRAFEVRPDRGPEIELGRLSTTPHVEQEETP